MNQAGTAAEIAVGLVLLVGTFYDLFQSVVLPRPAVNKVQLARAVVRPMWRVWRRLARIGGRRERSEARLAAFAPIALLTLFMIWAATLVAGYALVIDAIRDQFKPPVQDLAEAVYVSATTLVPLSYGDIVPTLGFARLILILESATGVALAALAITLLFELYGSFRSREEAVVALDALAGAPPSGVQMLEFASNNKIDGVLTETFEEWRRWSAMVLESHLAYPLLVYFRSTHDNEAWTNSFGAVMDAAALIMSSTEDPSKGSARLMFTVGSHLAEDLAGLFHFKTADDPIIEREEYDAAIARLSNAGYKVTAGAASWERFARLRSKYASLLNQLSLLLAAPSAQWAGDRTYLPHSTRPRRRHKA